MIEVKKVYSMRDKKNKILIICPSMWPKMNSWGETQRMYYLANCLAQHGWEVYTVSPKFKEKEEYTLQTHMAAVQKMILTEPHHQPHLSVPTTYVLQTHFLTIQPLNSYPIIPSIRLE